MVQGKAKLVFLLALTAATACAFAQTSVKDYLKLRKAQHVVQPISPQNLQQFVGTKIVELQGVVAGSCKSGTTSSLMLQLSKDYTQLVECPGDPPDWLLNGEVAVRVLAKVTRVDPDAELTATMMGVAAEGDISRVDEAYWRAEASKKSAPTHRSQNVASRGGDVRGWIGQPRFPASFNTISIPDSTLTAYADCIRHENRKLTVDQAKYIADCVIQLSVSFNVEPRLIMALLIVESDFDPASTSNHGAMGLGQLMPGTASWMGVRDPYDVSQNLYGTVKLMATLLHEYGTPGRDTATTLQLALAAYNAGEGAVKRHGGVPPYRETQAYVTRVIEIFNRLCQN